MAWSYKMEMVLSLGSTWGSDPSLFEPKESIAYSTKKKTNWFFIRTELDLSNFQTNKNKLIFSDSFSPLMYVFLDVFFYANVNVVFETSLVPYNGPQWNKTKPQWFFENTVLSSEYVAQNIEGFREFQRLLSIAVSSGVLLCKLNSKNNCMTFGLPCKQRIKHWL